MVRLNQIDDSILNLIALGWLALCLLAAFILWTRTLLKAIKDRTGRGPFDDF